jgi:hypothetical protein
MHFFSFPANLILFDLIILIICVWGVCTKEVIITQCSIASCYFIPLRPKYSPQNPVPEHPQTMFLPQRGRPSFTLC